MAGGKSRARWPLVLLAFNILRSEWVYAVCALEFGGGWSHLFVRLSAPKWNWDEKRYNHIECIYRTYTTIPYAQHVSLFFPLLGAPHREGTKRFCAKIHFVPSCAYIVFFYSLSLLGLVFCVWRCEELCISIPTIQPYIQPCAIFVTLYCDGRHIHNICIHKHKHRGFAV